MDINVVEAKMSVSKFRIAEVLINYHGLGLFLDVCLYKNEKLWVKMPEIWLNKTSKRRFCFWFTKEDSDKCQEIILNKVFDMLELDVEKAIAERQRYFEQRKKLTEEKNNITL